MSVFGGVVAFGGTAAAANSSVSVGNAPVQPTSVNDNESFQGSIDFNVTSVDTSDGTADGEIVVEFDTEFDLSSASVSTVAIDSTGTDSNTTSVASSINYTANTINLTFDDSGGAASDTLRTQLTVDGLSVIAGDTTAEVDTSVDAEADGTFEIDSTNVGSITINEDTKPPSVSESASDVTDQDATVNVAVTDNRAVDESTIDVNVTNSQTGDTYTLVQNGSVAMGSAAGSYNASDGSDNGTEFVNLSVALPEGDYTIGASAMDINGNSVDTTGVGNGFTVDMAGASLMPMNDDSNPLADSSASIDVVAVDKNGNELIFNDSNVNATASDIALTFDDPDNVTGTASPNGNEVPINHLGNGYNATFDVTYSEVGDLKITMSDFGGNLSQGSTTQTYTAEVKGVEVTPDSATLIADGSDTQTLTLQLVDQNGDAVERSGVSVSWGIISANKKDAGVTVDSSTTSTNTSGIANITYTATNSGYDVQVAGQTSNYADTGNFTTTAGDVSVSNSAFRLNGNDADVSGVQVNTTHNLSAEILDDQSNAVSDYPVTFTANGSTVATVNTDSDGFANTTVTLPTEKGVTQLNATAGPFNASGTSDAQINVTSIAADASTLVYTDDTRVVPADSSLDLTVEVRDEFGNVNTTARDITLNTSDLSVIDVAGSSSQTLTASANGNATFTVNANATSGSVTLTASSENVSDASAAFSINSPDAIELTFAPVSSITTSNDPAAYNGTVMQAQLVDSNDEELAIDGSQISFGKVSGNSAVLQSTSATTNSSGVATVIINSTSNTGVSDFIAQSSSYNVQGQTSIRTVGAVDSLNVEANATTLPAGETADLNATFRDANGYVVPYTDTVSLSTSSGTLGTTSLSVDAGHGGVVHGHTTLTSSTPGTANVTAIAQNAGNADELSVEFTQAATVSIANQTAPNGTSVTVDSVTLERDGYVAIHSTPVVENGSAANSVIGVSEYLTNGTYQDVTVTLFEGVPNQTFNASSLSDGDTIVAMPHEETNGNMSYDFVATGGSADGPYFTADGSAVTDTAVISTNATATQPANFEVSNLSPMDVTVTQGDSINVSAMVENTGDTNATQSVEFRVAGSVLASENVSLDAGANTTVEFTGINTSSLAAGNYTHGVYSADDNQTATLTVENASELGTLNVALSTSTVTANQSTDVVVTVTDNETGDAVENANVHFNNATQIVSTDANGTATLSVNVSAGTYEILVAANGYNDSTATLTVEEPAASANFDVSNLSPMDVTVTQGDSINVSAMVENTGGTNATQSVEFRVAGSVLASENVSLDAGANTTVEFTGINTSSLAAGNYTHGVYSADDNQTATLTVENATETGPVVLDDPAKDGDGQFAGDGLFQDVNGDGSVTLADVTALFNNFNDASVQDADGFDFNGDGSITLADVTTLFNSVTA